MPTRPKTHAERSEPYRGAAYDRDRGKARQFYSCRTWRKFRAAVLAEQPTCAECEKTNCIPVLAATDLDHIIPRIKRPDLTYERSNVQPLCKAHHSKKTAKENGFGEAGALKIDKTY